MVETPELLRDPVSWRAFLARMSAAGLGTAAAALIAGCGGSSNNANHNDISNPPPTNPGLTTFADQANFPGIPGQNENIVVLNYALTLETLEADLYRQALNIAAGQPLSTPLPSDGGASYTQAVGNGSLDSSLAPVGFLYLKQYAAVEAAHRDFLRIAIPSIGGTPVPANTKGYTTGLSAGAEPGDDFDPPQRCGRRRRPRLSGRGGFPDHPRAGAGGVYNLLHRSAALVRHQLHHRARHRPAAGIQRDNVGGQHRHRLRLSQPQHL